jgi:hypothetical protein
MSLDNARVEVAATELGERRSFKAGSKAADGAGVYRQRMRRLIHEGFVSRQLPAALDRYLTALPAMSLVPIAPFLSSQPRCCGLHIAQDERLGARERRHG